VLGLLMGLTIACGGADATGPTPSPTTSTWPPDIKTGMSAAAKAHLDEFLLTLKNHSLKRQTIDWYSMWQTAYAHVGAAQTLDALQPGFLRALDLLGDPRAIYYSPSGTAFSYDSSYLQGCRFSAPAQPLGAFPPDVVYASLGVVQPIGSQGLDQRWIREADRPGVVGWVLDLRSSTVDNFWAAVAMLGPLLGNGDVGGFVEPDESLAGSWKHVDGVVFFGSVEKFRLADTYRLLNGDPKLAVITDSGMQRQAEPVSVAFRGRPRTRSFGQPTCGYTDWVETFPLSSGGRLRISTWRLADRTGTRYSGPIVPDEVMPDAAALKQRVVEWLREK
jgi:hypothetical protein